MEVLVGCHRHLAFCFLIIWLCHRLALTSHQRKIYFSPFQNCHGVGPCFFDDLTFWRLYFQTRSASHKHIHRFRICLLMCELVTSRTSFASRYNNASIVLGTCFLFCSYVSVCSSSIIHVFCVLFCVKNVFHCFSLHFFLLLYKEHHILA